MLFLGVDGGGTKTAYLLTDEHGFTRATFEGPSCDYLGSSIDRVGSILREGVNAVLRAARASSEEIDGAFFGLPTYGEVRTDVAKLDAIPAEFLGHRRYRCGNDMLTAWAGSLAGEDGINVIAGTGSMAYGQFSAAECRVGGWGNVLGDEGSAYWIGLRLLNAVTRMSDGRLNRSGLYSAARDQLGLVEDFDLIGLFSAPAADHRRKVASLAQLVDSAAASGDSVADGILRDAAGELALLVRRTADALGFPVDRAALVSYSGGVFRSETVLTRFREELEGGNDRAFDLRRPLQSPVEGAALLARRFSSGSSN